MILLRFLLLGLSLVSLGLAHRHGHHHHRGPARGKKELLFYGPSVGDEVDIAVALGYTVNVMTADEWAALTDRDVKTYRAIIFGDPDCVGGASILDTAVANRKMWSRHVKGNIVVMGTDPSFHWTHGNVAGAKSLVEKALKFVTSARDKTGLYMTLSCYYHGSPQTTVTVLDQFGTFGVVAATGCSNAAHVVSGGGVLDALTDAELSNWGCSVHEVLYEMPPEFAALAIATDSVGVGVGKYWDGTSGAPYIVARGVRVRRCGNGKKERGEECDDGNNRNGDGCSSVCKKERRPHHGDDHHHH